MQNMVGSFWNLLEKHIVRKTRIYMKAFWQSLGLVSQNHGPRVGWCNIFTSVYIGGNVYESSIVSQCSWPISIKCSTDHPWIKGIYFFFKYKVSYSSKQWQKLNQAILKFSRQPLVQKSSDLQDGLFLRNADSSLFKSWSPKLGGVTMGKSIFKYVYIGKRIKKLHLKNRWARYLKFT